MSEVRIDYGPAILVFDTDDIEELHVGVLNYIVEEPSEDGKYMTHRLTGDHHLKLDIDFKHGKKARFEPKPKKET